MNAEMRQEFVHVLDFQVVIFLVPRDDEAAALFNEFGQHLDVGAGHMGRRRTGADGFVAGIDDHQQFHALE